MVTKKVMLLAAAALTSLSAVAKADGYVQNGWYVGLEGGITQVRDTSLPNLGINTLKFDDRGPTVLGTVGYAFPENYRVELELGSRYNEVDTVNNFPTSGRLKEYTAMVNAVYDLRLTDHWSLGTGLGVGIDANYLKVPGLKDKQLNFAAQGILGLTYAMAQHWDLVLNYRYLWVDDPTYGALRPVTGGPPTLVEDDMDIGKHTFTIGFRYGFDEQPAPVAPAEIPPPLPPTPKQFIIFFGFNKCNITAEADAVLSEAASAAKSAGAASVRIVGHTDTVGSNSYNQKLSECRANAAKSNLVGKGVSEGSISASGRGESELIVQTGDGVKEPQNRRATVDLQ